MRWITTALIGWVMAMGLSTGSLAEEPLRVVVTIKPVHSLVAAIMEGAGEPQVNS